MLFSSSKKAKLDGTKAIRGGIPVCFPRFGPWEFGAQHGFARISHDWKTLLGPVVDENTGDVKVSKCISSISQYKTRRLFRPCSKRIQYLNILLL